MSLTLSDFRDMALQLLPAGPAWPRDPDSQWGVLLEALLPEFVRISAAVAGLKDEMSPVTTIQLFDFIEREYGLPAPCITGPQTLAQRRTALRERHLAVGRQDRQFFIDLAASIGYPITIDEFNAANPGPAGTYNVRRASGEITQITPNGDDWNYIWRINAPAVVNQRREYPSEYGNPYVLVSNEILECTVRQYLHCHRVVIFAYS